MSRCLLAPAFIVMIAACSASDTQAPETKHSPAMEAPVAIGFITDNPVLPENITLQEGDPVARDPDGRPYSYALLGQSLPALSGQMADGALFDPASLDGWTVIDVWGIWCGDCMVDSPYVAALARAIDQDPDLSFLSVHTPANDRRTSDEEMFGKFGSVAAFFEAKGYSYPTLIDTDASLRNALKISWTPSYLLVDPEGVIRGFRTDLSVAGSDPVKDFLKQVALVKKDRRTAGSKVPAQPATIGLEGAMDLTGAIPFTASAMRTAFPGYEIIPGHHLSPDTAYPFFEVFEEGDPAPLYRIEPDWALGQVRKVSTRHPGVIGPSGEKIGAFSPDRLNMSDRAACKHSQEAGPPTLICIETGKSAEFHRIFDTAAGIDAAILVEMAYLPDHVE